MKVEKINNQTYQLTISAEVAGVLCTIFEKIGGDPKETPRAVTDALSQLLKDAFYGKPDSIGFPFRRFPTEGGSIYFEKCSLEKLKKEIADALPETQFWKITKSWRGGSGVHFIALPVGVEVSEDMLENIGNFTNGGAENGFSIEAEKVDTLPNDATLLSNNKRIKLF